MKVKRPLIHMNRRRDIPWLVSVVVLGGRDETEFLALAASLACAAEHPLGAAILDSSLECDVELRPVSNFQVIAGKGVTGLVDGNEVALGKPTFFADLGLSLGDFGEWAERLARHGQRVMFVAIDRQIAGFLGMADPPSVSTVRR